MDRDREDPLSAVVARQRGRTRLRTATVALGAAGLVAAGAVAYTLPGVTHATGTGTAVTATASGHSRAVHATSGGSAAAAAASGRSGQSGQAAPAAAGGTSHAVSGGS